MHDADADHLKRQAERELAALREENARQDKDYAHLGERLGREIEDNTRLRGENTQLHDELEARRRLGNIDRDHLAALREENARLRDENEALQQIVDSRDLTNDDLRAQVAALVQAARPFVQPGSSNPMDPAVIALEALLDAPDLAALVAREQAREAVIAVTRAHAEAFKDSASCASLVDALRALDAGVT